MRSGLGGMTGGRVLRVLRHGDAELQVDHGVAVPPRDHPVSHTSWTTCRCATITPAGRTRRSRRRTRWPQSPRSVPTNQWLRIQQAPLKRRNGSWRTPIAERYSNVAQQSPTLRALDWRPPEPPCEFLRRQRHQLGKFTPIDTGSRRECRFRSRSREFTVEWAHFLADVAAGDAVADPRPQLARDGPFSSMAR
jgi:hypothetical protein